MLEELIRKRVRLKGQPADRDARNKLIAYLMRRGFSYDLVMRKVREMGSIDETDA